MKKLLFIPFVVLGAGCSLLNGGKIEVDPADVAAAGACVAQVQVLVSTAQSQVSACVALGKSVKAKADAK